MSVNPRAGWRRLASVVCLVSGGCSTSNPDAEQQEAPVGVVREGEPTGSESPESATPVVSNSPKPSEAANSSSGEPGATAPDSGGQSPATNPSTAIPANDGSGETHGIGETSSATGATSDVASSPVVESSTDQVSAAPGGGDCTPSEPAGSRVSGSGPHEVVVETNADPGITEGTIFRPADLGGASEKYPIFVWGQGGCSQNGLSNSAAMAEIASHGYFVIADGVPNGSGNRPMDRANLASMGAPLLAYVDWAIAENSKPCSAYYQSLDTTMVASNGFSCGGMMAQGTVLDSRIVTWGVTSSGMAGANQAFYDAIHTPVLFVEGGPDEVAYDGGLEGYNKIAELGVPVMWFDKALGHGGDLFQANGGDFTKINLAWLNWWLKGDETASGKGALVGSSCSYCSDGSWDVRSANVP